MLYTPIFLKRSIAPAWVCCAVCVAGISKNEQQSRSDDDTNIGKNEDEHKEQTVQSELGFSKSHNQDDNMALKLKSVI